MEVVSSGVALRYTSDIKLVKDGQDVKLDGVVGSIETRQKRNYAKGGTDDYTVFSVQDSLGMIHCNDWDNGGAEEFMELYGVEPGDIVEVKGITNFFAGQMQVNAKQVRRITKEELTFQRPLLPVYDTTWAELEFVRIVNNLPEKYRDIIREVTSYDDQSDPKWEAFTKSPSAVKYHGNRVGGLIQHTVAMMKLAEKIKIMYTEEVPGYENILSSGYDEIDFDRLILKVVLHDIMKQNEYVYDVFIGRNADSIGHIYEGVWLIEDLKRRKPDLIDPELAKNLTTAILAHHGSMGPEEPKNPEDLILHMLDMIDSRVVGSIESFIF